MAAITEAFSARRVVAISDPRTQALNRVVVALMHEPAFRSRARVIVYDCCARRYQRLVDRYVSGGDVSLSAVARAWEHAGPAIPRPNLFVAARTLNRRVPARQRIRIVLAHPLAEGTFVCKRGQRCNVWGDGLDRVIAEVIEEEVFQRGENALLLAAHWKLDRRRRPSNPRGFGFDSAVRRIERRHPGTVFLAWGLKVCTLPHSPADEVVARWPAPAMAEIHGTSVGAAPETLLWSCVKDSGLRGLALARPSVGRTVDENVDAIIALRSDGG
jgi:hypothetical protein